MNQSSALHTGYVSIIGRPNVGKSTLLNRLIDQKLSIVSRKPQTTRHQLLGINTTADAQVIYIDTPGLQTRPKHALNRYMNRQVTNVLAGIDIVLFVIEAMKWTEEDDQVLDVLMQQEVKNIFLVINKIDKAVKKEDLLPFIESVQSKIEYAEVALVSAKKNSGIDELEQLVINALPLGPALYPDDAITDRNERFFAAEFLREKLMTRLGDELPYRLTITIDQFKHVDNVIHIDACIWVEKQGQKSIVIGKKGAVLKAAGTDARQEMEQLFGNKVNLKTWVKVKDKWTESEKALKMLGYHE